MNKIFYVLPLMLFTFLSYAQSPFESRIREIKNEISSIIQNEKEALRKEVENINLKLENKEITVEEANKQKNIASEKTAHKIETSIEPLEKEIQNLVRQEVNEETIAPKDNRIDNLEDIDDEEDVYNKKRNRNWNNNDFSFNWNRGRNSRRKSESITTSQFVFAFGLNNIVTDNDLGTIEGNGIRVSNSRFYEWGWTWKTRLAPNSAFLNLKYGMSLTYNNLRPDNNTYYVKNDKTTILAEHPFDLRDEPYFRMTNLVIPVHLEFDFSKKRKIDDDKTTIVRSQKSIRLGVGGYAGINTRTKQILKYRNDGLKTDQTTKGDYNTSDFIYGLSGYIGYKDISLYTKYDLNTIFTDNVTDQRNISFGLRFDFN